MTGIIKQIDMIMNIFQIFISAKIFLIAAE